MHFVDSFEALDSASSRPSRADVCARGVSACERVACEVPPPSPIAPYTTIPYCTIHHHPLFEVHKRYSDFEQLHCDLGKSAGGRMPGKTFFGSNTSEKIIRERMQGLHSYIQATLANASTAWAPCVDAFLKASVRISYRYPLLQSLTLHSSCPACRAASS